MSVSKFQIKIRDKLLSKSVIDPKNYFESFLYAIIIVSHLCEEKKKE